MVAFRPYGMIAIHGKNFEAEICEDAWSMMFEEIILQSNFETRNIQYGTVKCKVVKGRATTIYNAIGFHALKPGNKI